MGLLGVFTDFRVMYCRRMSTSTTTTTSEAECALGEPGVDSCLDGYVPITSPQVCDYASSALGLLYDPSQNKNLGTNNAFVCNWCGGCDPASVRVDDCHFDLARWVCCKTTTATTTTITTTTA